VISKSWKSIRLKLRKNYPVIVLIIYKFLIIRSDRIILHHFFIMAIGGGMDASKKTSDSVLESVNGIIGDVGGYFFHVL